MIYFFFLAPCGLFGGVIYIYNVKWVLGGVIIILVFCFLPWRRGQGAGALGSAGRHRFLGGPAGASALSRGAQPGLQRCLGGKVVSFAPAFGGFHLPRPLVVSKPRGAFPVARFGSACSRVTLKTFFHGLRLVRPSFVKSYLVRLRGGVGGALGRGQASATYK